MKETVFSVKRDLRLQYKLFGLWVLSDVRSQTDGAGTFTGRVLTSRYQTVDVLQQLGLAGARVTTQQDVDIRPKGKR